MTTNVLAEMTPPQLVAAFAEAFITSTDWFNGEGGPVRYRILTGTALTAEQTTAYNNWLNFLCSVVSPGSTLSSGDITTIKEAVDTNTYRISGS